VAGTERTVEATARSAAPPEAVFDLVADGARWQEWVRFVPRSVVEREGVPAPDGVGSVRRFGLGPLASREEITVFDRPRRIEYVARSGLPVRSYRAEVDLEPDGTGGTVVRWRGIIEPLPGTGPVMVVLFARLLRSLADGAARRTARP
jgi:uncharacterized protein YndB with AHSA1/START domain